MAEDYRKVSRESLERATRISEIAIFLGLVAAICVVVVGIVKGMLG
jgi:t-SNARE complex subunit (syntaxin)